MQFSSYKSSTPVENEICSSNLLGDAATSSLRISASYLGNLPSGYDLINHSQPLQSSSISDLLAVAHISTQPIHLIGADSAPQDFKEGTLVPATMLASLLASRGCLHHPSSSFACYNGFPTSTIQMQQPNPIFQSTGFAAEDCWIPDLSPDHRFHPAMFTNELSLSLVRTDSSIHDQCSELNPSAITDHHDSGGCSEQSNIPTSSSSYLKSVHQILEDLSRFVSENVHFRCYSGSSPSNAASVSDECPETAGNMSLQKPQIRSKEKQLTTLLKMVDEGYSQCLTEVRNIVSAFHPMTGSDPDATARFLLRSTTFLYDSLKERISARILNTKENKLSNSQAAEAFERSFIHKKWALQEIRRKEHQLWRPQRGLPERSVSVLRSWMFQNFLHPYPKDSDKQMLAMKSGLTRSQVSNWFINARVRLWKPMIEEMYTEISVRKARWKSHGAENSGRGRIRGLQCD